MRVVATIEDPASYDASSRTWAASEANGRRPTHPPGGSRDLTTSTP